MRRLLLALLSIMIFSGMASAAGIESFSPHGEVKQVRQIAVRFTHEMMPLGDPRLPQPFDIDCVEKGSGRWVDSKNWVFDFEHDLPAGVRCTFSLKPGKTLDGTPLNPESKNFSTGGPAILTALPYDGNEAIDENQIFVLGLDAPVNANSLAGKVWCVAEGVGEKIPVRPVNIHVRKKVLENARAFFADYGYALDKRSLQLYFLRLPGGTVKDKIIKATNTDSAPVVVLQCARGNL